MRRTATWSLTCFTLVVTTLLGAAATNALVALGHEPYALAVVQR